MTKLYEPEKIYIEKGAEKYPFTRRLLERLPETPTEIVSDKKALLQKIRPVPDPIGFGKRCLLLAIDRGRAFKPFPNPEGAVSCNFYSLHLVEGCDLECSYCILQAYLTNPLLTVYVNGEEILEGLHSFLQAHPEGRYRIGTGQLADSLSLDPLTAHTELLIPFFARHSNAALELKTKSVNIARLEKLDPRGRTVVSWSLNTERVQRLEEHKCASIEERLRAAKRCVEWGYWVGFHLDPLIDYEGCLEEYEALLERLFESVPAEKVAWVSLGSLRFMPQLKRMMEKRFPKSSLPYAEWVRGFDGKMRYAESRRRELYESLLRPLCRLAPEVPVYLCMETDRIWRRVFGEKTDPALLADRLDRRMDFFRELKPGRPIDAACRQS